MNTGWLKVLISVIFLISLAFFALIPNSDRVVKRQLVKPPQIIRAKDVIKERTNFGIETTKIFIDKAVDNGFPSLFDTLTPLYKDLLEKEGLSIFIFEDDQLSFWSENLDVKDVPEYSDRLVKVQNKWCIAYWISLGSIKGLLLVEIRNTYPYQNKFLQNSFHGSLSFLDGYFVSPTPFDGSFPVALYSSVPVFYLSYIPQSFDKQKERLIALVSRAGFLALYIAIYLSFWLPFFRKKGVISLSILSILIVGIRLVNLYFHLSPQGSWKLFGPEIFAYSWLAPSLSDFLINSIIVFALSCYAYRVLVKQTIPSLKLRNVLMTVMGGLSLVTFFTTDSLISILVLNSTVTFEAYQIFNLSIYSMLGYLSVSLWFVSALIIYQTSLVYAKDFTLSKTLIIYGVVFLVVFSAYTFSFSAPSFYGVIMVLLVVALMAVFRPSSNLLHSNVFVVVVLFFSLYSVMLVSHAADEKDQSIRKIIAVNLANERDPVAEVMFPQVARRLYSDDQVIAFLDNINEKEVDLYQYISENYLSGYFKKYDYQITVCLSTSDLMIEKTNEIVGCYSFFEDMLNDFGIRIPGTSFYHLNNQNGRISYLGMIEYVLPDGEEICIYIELDSKLSRELLGYPELLLDGKVAARSTSLNYSSAKYYFQNLIARTGDYNYPLVNRFQIDSVGRYSFFDKNGYSHMGYSGEPETIIVLSKPKVSLFNITASFAWIFLFFYVSLLIWLWLGGLPVALNTNIPSFKNRIKNTMVLVLFLSLIMVGSVTIVYSVKSFEKKNYDNLNEKLISTIIDVESNIVGENLLWPEYSTYLTNYLVQLSNVFQTDINIYDASGVLLASSRPEVFERNLLSKLIDPFAWRELAINHGSKLIHTESIGKMQYLSAYAPLFDVDNKKVAFINLPYFTRQGEFMREVFSLIVVLINIYALLILFAIFIAVLISNRISKPLEVIREKLSKVDITRHNETILYEGRDEVGKLVNEYNRMVFELAESAQKIVQSQRQSAWREMAKQIAHEIKNPLTPIKLNLQHLVRAKRSNSPEWEMLFDRFAETLDDQINVLSNIATEFSSFANMPVGQFDNVNLNKVVNDAVTLFSGYSNIKIIFASQSELDIVVYADREQLQRVFVNLIKNAIQAIGKKVNGLIEIVLTTSENLVKVAVTDNGGGIMPNLQHKLFSPNFTTKSGGMGLGLAISKGVVDLIDGRIWFETEYGKGTTFFVELKIADEKKS